MIVRLGEEWKPIKGYEGLYEVSNMGRVKSLHHGKERILRTPDNLRGYKSVWLAKQTIREVKRVHRLVAEAFIPNPMNLPVVNHLDGDKHNNCISNLEWCTSRENTNHAIKTGLMKSRFAPKQIMAYKGDKLVGTFGSIGECANKLNCDIRNISGVIHGRRKTHHGFSFKLVNDDDLSLGSFRDCAIKVMAIKGAKIIKAKSYYELAKQLGVLCSSVYLAFKRGTKVNGFTIKKED